MGVMTALLEREASGEGQWVQVSLLQAMIALLDFQAARWLVAHEVPGQSGNDHPTSIPTGVFPTSDGHINLAAGEQAMWERLCRALGAEKLLAEPAFATAELRSENRVACNRALSEVTATRTAAEWLPIFERSGVAAGPIYKMDEVFADPQVQHLNMAVPVRHPAMGNIALVGQPFLLTRTPSEIRSTPPACGEHTDEVLRELGYRDGEIADLKKRLVV
jgi:formyl-CoA transferase